MAKYRKKPVVVDAFEWTGGHDQTEDPEWIVKAITEGKVTFMAQNNEVFMGIMTLEGLIVARQGDYIVKGIQGELYPCKPGIFEATYDLVTDIASNDVFVDRLATSLGSAVQGALAEQIEK